MIDINKIKQMYFNILNLEDTEETNEKFITDLMLSHEFEDLNIEEKYYDFLIAHSIINKSMLLTDFFLNEASNKGEEFYREYYEEHKEDFKKPLSRDVKHIFTKKKKDIKEAEKELTEGIKFDALVLKYSECQSKLNGGSIGCVPIGGLDKRVEKVIFDTPLNRPTKIIKSDNGYHIFLSSIEYAEKQYEFNKDKEEIINRVIGILAKERTEEVLKRRSNGQKNI